jgi:predicted DNA-binding transcriptional regulator YafY
LPAAQRNDEERARNRVYVDALGWSAEGEATPHLRTIYQGIREDSRLHLIYRTFLGIEVVQTVEPLGLIAKAGIWYLAYAFGGRTRTRRVSDIQGARLADEHFARPPDFDLAAFWRAECAEREANRLPFLANVRLAPALIPYLPRYLDEQVADLLARAEPADAEGWVTATLPFESFEAAREHILGLGSAAEVLAPDALRRSVADFAAQTLSRYRR